MTTLMEQETRESAGCIEKQLADNAALVEEVGAKIRAFDPQSVMTVGRGSSDHAGMFAKYLIEVELGLPVSSAAPSVSSIYKQQMKLDKTLVIFISQSGRSPDIIAQAEMAKKSGALCVALLNEKDTPLGDVAHAVIPLKAGPERAVAATKSYLTTLTALLHLVSVWSDNKQLLADLLTLPSKFDAIANGPSQLLPADFKTIDRCMVIGRGFGFAISLEIALKLKEVCAIQAEAFSSAEFFHGPVTLIRDDLAIVDIVVQDESLALHTENIQEMAQRGAALYPMKIDSDKIHPRLIPLLILYRFYLDVEKISLDLGINPDAPQGLGKVTKTI